jgi:hypothetical protein
VTRVTLRSAPRTVHLARTALSGDGTVITWCGRRGTGYQPTASAWRQCQLCLRAERDAAVTPEGGLDGPYCGSSVAYAPWRTPETCCDHAPDDDDDDEQRRCGHDA